MIVTTCKQIL